MTATALSRRPTVATVALAVIGAVGSGLVARASYVVGALPRHHLDRAVATGPYRWVYEVGVALLVVAWLGLGRLALDPAVAGMVRRLGWAAATMAAPLLLAAPVASQDVWTYLAQANVAAHGLDPYTVGPAAVPGPYAHAVAHEWLTTGSPYGPLWLSVCRLVVQVTQPHPWAGMFALRALAVAGVAATGLALTRLARATGARPEVALWLAVTGPFPLLMLLGGVHNESVMLPLLVGGVATAATSATLRRAVLLGSALVGAAAAVKVVALVALPFLPLLWFAYADPARADESWPPPLRRWLTAALSASALGVVVLLSAGFVTGFGLGWVSHVGDGRIGVRWLSVTQQIGSLLHLVVPAHVADLPAERYALLHPIGLVFLAVTLAAVTATARRRPPVRTLAMATLLILVSSPAPRTWYLMWPLVFLAADRLTSRAVVAVTAATATIVLWFPASVRPQPPVWLLVVLFVLLTLVTTSVVRPGASLTRGDARG